MSLPNRILTIIDPSHQLPPGHPAAGKGQIDGQADGLCLQRHDLRRPGHRPRRTASSAIEAAIGS